MALSPANPTPAANASNRTTSAPGSKSEASFNEVMDSALDAAAPETKPQTGTAPAPTQETGSTGDADQFTDAILKDNADAAADESAAAPVDILSTLSAQIVLAMAAVTATPQPMVATPVSAEESAPTPMPSAEALSSATTVPATASAATAPSVSTPTTASTPLSASTAQITSTQTEQIVLSSAAAGNASVPIEEKNTAEKSAVGTKIPISNSGSTTASTKNRTVPVSQAHTNPAQVTTAKQDNVNVLSTTNTIPVAVTATPATAGTRRADELPMQSIQEVWPQNAFRAFAATVDSGSFLSQSTEFRSTQTITLTSNDQFADAVEKAINSQRELYPRRVEIQMHTPPGATVTLSLARVNGQLRAQFDANNAQTLNWLQGEARELQTMNFGLPVRWAPPQLAVAAQQEAQAGRDRQDERRRDDDRRKNQPRMDAQPEETSPLEDVLSKRG